MFAANRRITTLTVAAISVLTILTFSFAPASASRPQAAGSLVSAASGKCLDHEDWGTGHYAIVYDCNGAANQRWWF